MQKATAISGRPICVAPLEQRKESPARVALLICKHLFSYTDSQIHRQTDGYSTEPRRWSAKAQSRHSKTTWTIFVSRSFASLAPPSIAIYRQPPLQSELPVFSTCVTSTQRFLFAKFTNGTAKATRKYKAIQFTLFGEPYCIDDDKNYDKLKWGHRDTASWISTRLLWWDIFVECHCIKDGPRIDNKGINNAVVMRRKGRYSATTGTASWTPDDMESSLATRRLIYRESEIINWQRKRRVPQHHPISISGGCCVSYMLFMFIGDYKHRHSIY